MTQLLESVYRPQHFYVFHVDFRKVEWPDCHKFTELQKIWISPIKSTALAAGWKILNFWLLKQFFNKFTFVKQSGRSIERILSDSISYVWLKNDFPSLTMSSSYLKVNIRCQIVPLSIPIFHSQIRGHTISKMGEVCKWVGRRVVGYKLELWVNTNTIFNVSI